jgi:hypothetical protein
VLCSFSGTHATEPNADIRKENALLPSEDRATPSSGSVAQHVYGTTGDSDAFCAGPPTWAFLPVALSLRPSRLQPPSSHPPAPHLPAICISSILPRARRRFSPRRPHLLHPHRCLGTDLRKLAGPQPPSPWP